MTIDPNAKGLPGCMKISLLAVTLVAGLAVIPLLHAGEEQGSMMMSQGGMTMMKDMMERSQMMDQCSQMMQGMTGTDGAQIPNEQWRRDRPAEPGAQD